MSVCGSLSIITLITVVFTACGSVFHISVYQSIFVALCLSFSSTALVIKFLNDDTGEDVMDLRFVDLKSLLIVLFLMFNIEKL